MAGQPKETFLTFDVTKLVSKESGAEAYEQYILDLNEEFSLEVTFEGSGQGWRNMCDRPADYEVQFYAEGLGAAAPDSDFGSETDTLVGGNYGPYSKEKTIAGGIATEGVYKCVAVVTFPNDPGVLGFCDELLIQIHERESHP